MPERVHYRLTPPQLRLMPLLHVCIRLPRKRETEGSLRGSLKSRTPQNKLRVREAPTAVPPARVNNGKQSWAGSGSAATTLLVPMVTCKRNICCLKTWGQSSVVCALAEPSLSPAPAATSAYSSPTAESVSNPTEQGQRVAEILPENRNINAVRRTLPTERRQTAHPSRIDKHQATAAGPLPAPSAFLPPSPSPSGGPPPDFSSSLVTVAHVPVFCRTTSFSVSSTPSSRIS